MILPLNTSVIKEKLPYLKVGIIIAASRVDVRIR